MRRADATSVRQRIATSDGAHTPHGPPETHRRQNAAETIRVIVAARGAAQRGERVPRPVAAPDPGRQSRPVTAGRLRTAKSDSETAEGEGRLILGRGSGNGMDSQLRRELRKTAREISDAET